jgi:S-(hydroxymethyl)glutathione dehydrogenase/alcohol dehydrogenase
VRPLPSDRTNLCLAIREQQNQGYLPDGTTRLGRDGEPIRHFMGTSTFAEYTVMPEIALAKVDPRRRSSTRASSRAALDRPRRGDEHGEGEPGSTCVRLRRGHGRARRVCGLPLQGAERIVCVDLSPQRLELARTHGATDTLPGGSDAVDAIVEMTDGFGADYTFEATGNVNVMRQAVESARMGWGLCTVAGVAGKGARTLDIVPRFLITAGAWRARRSRREGTGPGSGARRARARRRHRRRVVRLAPHPARRRQPRFD